MWQSIQRALTFEITKRDSREVVNARLAAMKERLGSFWHIAWILLVVNYILGSMSLSVAARCNQVINLKPRQLQYAGSKWLGWTGFDGHLDIQCLGAVVFFLIAAIMVGVVWKIERKRNALWVALGLLALAGAVTFFCYRSFAWTGEMETPFLQLTAMVWLLYAEIAYLGVVAFRQFAPPRSG